MVLLELASAENQIDCPMFGIESILVFQEDLLCKHLEPLYEYPNQGIFPQWSAEKSHYRSHKAVCHLFWKIVVIFVSFHSLGIWRDFHILEDKWEALCLESSIGTLSKLEALFNFICLMAAWSSKNDDCYDILCWIGCWWTASEGAAEQVSKVFFSSL